MVLTSDSQLILLLTLDTISVVEEEYCLEKGYETEIEFGS